MHYAVIQYPRYGFCLSSLLSRSISGEFRSIKCEPLRTAAAGISIARQHVMHAERDIVLTTLSVRLSVCLCVCPSVRLSSTGLCLNEYTFTVTVSDDQVFGHDPSFSRLTVVTRFQLELT